MIEEKLDELYFLETMKENELAILDDEKASKIKSLLGDDLFAQLQNMNDTYASLIDEAEAEYSDKIKQLQKEIKAETVKHGETVKAEHYMSIFVQPKPAWDGKMLEGYAAVHPEILAFKTEKSPYVSIRKVKK